MFRILLAVLLGMLTGCGSGGSDAAGEPGVGVGNAQLPDARSGMPVSVQLQGAFGTPPYAFRISEGTLPPGLTHAGSTVQGNPTTGGSWTFTVEVEDSHVPPRVGHNRFDVNIDTPSTFRVNPGAAGNRFGNAAAIIDDVNGDGTPDFAVGCPHDDAGGNDAGAVWMCSGVDGATLWKVNGDNAADQFGASLDAIGDISGDGVEDLAVGAWQHSSGLGMAKVLSGVDGTELWSQVGYAATKKFGTAVAGVGDCNGDGTPDFAVSSPQEITAGYHSGAFRVYSGADFSVLHFISAEQADEHLGTSLDGAGDIDQDGYDDFMAGAPYADAGAVNSGMVRVYSGRDGSKLQEFGGSGFGHNMGYSCGNAGDVDRDGIEDVIVGTPMIYDPPNPGSATVYSGRTGEQLHHWSSDTNYDFFGCSVAGVGDLDGDGFADVMVGAYGDDDAPTPGVGTARAYSGRTGEELLNLSDTTGGYFGWNVMGRGSVQTDGWSILVVTAPISSNAGHHSGSVFVWLDRPTRPGRRVGQIRNNR